jgi:hypothetical protein
MGAKNPCWHSGTVKQCPGTAKQCHARAATKPARDSPGWGGPHRLAQNLHLPVTLALELTAAWQLSANVESPQGGICGEPAEGASLRAPLHATAAPMLGEPAAGTVESPRPFARACPCMAVARVGPGPFHLQPTVFSWAHPSCSLN